MKHSLSQNRVMQTKTKDSGKVRLKHILPVLRDFIYKLPVSVQHL